MVYSLKQLAEHKGFILALAKRELDAKYKQSFLGKLWIVIQPFMFMLILTIVFSKFARLPSEGVPYALFFLTALLPWNFFTNAVGSAPNIIVGQTGLIKQRAFYRLSLVINRLLTESVNYFYSLISLVILFIYFQITPSWTFVMVIPLFILQAILIMGFMMLLSSLNVYVRDIGLATPIITRLWFYLSPVIYSYHSIGEEYQKWLILNPMTGILDGYRRILLHGEMPDIMPLIYTLGFSLVIFVVGFTVFNKLEKKFADVL
ncbi:ABC transporter permease [Metabacillus indicus]|uniref:Transport permease protein n=1 Tax=Metabacillus indicus TaxID=246786 RepID=A0A084GXV8_METID|nr:ABC transporter permease [Metabacillus indicus]KEZ52170.1 ABC transporter permease [Metabacillus indicus]